MPAVGTKALDSMPMAFAKSQISADGSLPDGPVGSPGWALLQPRSSGAFERSIVVHASRPSRATDSGMAVRACRSPARA